MCKLTDEEVKNRIDARHAAETIAELADEQAMKYGKVFWERLHKICCAHVPCLLAAYQRATAMNQQESREFGQEVIPFGKHQGIRVDEIPLDYLEWYADLDFVDKARRYLRSRRIREENNE